MLDNELPRAVERFAEVVGSAPDSALDRDWAWGAYDSEGVRFAFFRTYEELQELAVMLTAGRASGISSAQRILAQYHAAYRDLQAAVIGIDDRAADEAPTEDEWSIRDTVAHIVTADAGFFVVTKYALERYRSHEDLPAEIPDEFWDAVLGDENTIRATLAGPLQELRAYYKGLHTRVLKEFGNITEEELSAPSIYWEGYEMSLRFRLHRFDSHLRQHTVQVDKTRESIGRAPSESGRLLRLIYRALAEAEGATIGAWENGLALQREVAEKVAARADEIDRLLG
jgi:uncharacterized damage-inducible protein DinB